MLIVIKVKETENIIGLKEDIAARLEGVVGIERINVFENGAIKIINPPRRKETTS